ncbi:hypothetical protein Tco_1315283 [Tanacetum coccineum]
MGTPTQGCVLSCPNFSDSAGRPFRCVSDIWILISGDAKVCQIKVGKRKVSGEDPTHGLFWSSMSHSPSVENETEFIMLLRIESGTYFRLVGVPSDLQITKIAVFNDLMLYHQDRRIQQKKILYFEFLVEVANCSLGECTVADLLTLFNPYQPNQMGQQKLETQVGLMKKHHKEHLITWGYEVGQETLGKSLSLAIIIQSKEQCSWESRVLILLLFLNFHFL